MKLRKPSSTRRKSLARTRPLPKPERASQSRPSFDRQTGGRAEEGEAPAPVLTPAQIRSAAESQKIALLAAQAGLDKKASGVEILDVTGKVDYADFLVLMTGQSDRHVAAIAQAVDSLLSEHGHQPASVEGLPRGNWVLVDLVDVVVHVFLQESRSLYDLDGLWMDARRLPVPEST